jgi:hypothetical protein
MPPFLLTIGPQDGSADDRPRKWTRNYEPEISFLDCALVRAPFKQRYEIGFAQRASEKMNPLAVTRIVFVTPDIKLGVIVQVVSIVVLDLKDDGFCAEVTEVVEKISRLPFGRDFCLPAVSVGETAKESVFREFENIWERHRRRSAAQTLNLKSQVACVTC